MFERFTSEARDAVERAQEEARSTVSPQIDSRHLLVALVECSDRVTAALRVVGADPEIVIRATRDAIAASGLDRNALRSLGIDLDTVTALADEAFGEGALARAGRKRGHIPFAGDSKKALELALREAIRLRERRIESRHLLLGLLRAEGAARALLAELGVDIDDLRGGLEQPNAA